MADPEPTLTYEIYLDQLRGRKLDRRKPPSEHLKVRARVGLVAGRWELVGLEIAAGSAPDADGNPAWSRGIKATDVRELLVTELIDRTVTANRKGSEIVLHAAAHPPTPARPKRNPRVPPAAAAAAKDQVALLTQKRGRALQYDEDHYRQVANVYTEAGGRQPTAEVAKRFHLSSTAAAKHVAKARHEFGFLPPTKQGKPSGGIPGAAQS